MKKLFFAALFFSAPAMGMDRIREFFRSKKQREEHAEQKEKRLLANEQEIATLKQRIAMNEQIVTNIELLAAIMSNRIADVEKALNKGADLNWQDVHEESTPLHLAAQFDRDALATILIEKGADITIQNRDGETPLDIAQRKYGEDSEIYKVLYEAWRKRFQSSIKGIAL